LTKAGGQAKFTKRAIFTTKQQEIISAYYLRCRIPPSTWVSGPSGAAAARRGPYPHKIFKGVAETSLAGKTAGMGNFLDGQGGASQQMIGGAYPGHQHVVVGGITDFLFELPDKVKAGQRHTFRKVFGFQRLPDIFGYIGQ
jgi:hypothetical protein